MTEQVFTQQFNQMPTSLKQELLAYFEYLLFKHQVPPQQSPPKDSAESAPAVSRQPGWGKDIFLYVAPDFDDTPAGFEE